MKNSIEKLKNEALIKLKLIEVQRGITWVCMKTGIPYSTVNHWLWAKNIPAKRIDLIENLYQLHNSLNKKKG
jgi:hypothetical protein